MAVIDAAVAVKAVLPNPLQESCLELLEVLSSQEEVLAPELWAYETTSAVTKAVRFGHLSADRGREALELLDSLAVRRIPTDQDQVTRAYSWTLELDRAAAYDSFYLALAETQKCDLWTADRRLVNSVQLPWVRSVAPR